MFPFCTRILSRFAVVKNYTSQLLSPKYKGSSVEVVKSISHESERPFLKPLPLPMTKLARNFHLLQVSPFKEVTTESKLLNFKIETNKEQIRTFKMKLRLKKRCGDCYFVYKEGQWMNLCKTHPRHKQKKLQPKPEHYWILTHATQGTKRPW